MFKVLISIVVVLFLGKTTVYADTLDCSSAFAIHKVEIDLGENNHHPVKLTTCTDTHDWVLGRAYIEWQDSKGKEILTELPYGGCGGNAVHAIRDKVGDRDEILISFHSCQSREYHPKPEWFMTLLKFNKTGDKLTVVKRGVKL